MELVNIKNLFLGLFTLCFKEKKLIQFMRKLLYYYLICN